MKRRTLLARLGMIGVAVGVMALIIALALMTGLQGELRDRILGRTAAEDVLHPETRAVLAAAGTMLEEDLIDELEAAGVDEVKVRTALTCETRFGLCAKCYGREIGRAHV